MALNDVLKQQAGVKADVPVWNMVLSDLQSMIFSLEHDVQKYKGVMDFVKDLCEVERIKGEALRLENQRLQLWLDDPKLASNCLGLEFEDYLQFCSGHAHHEDNCSQMTKMQEDQRNLIEDMLSGLEEHDAAKDLPWIINLCEAMPPPLTEIIAGPAELSVPYPKFARGPDAGLPCDEMMKMEPMPAMHSEFSARLEPAPEFFMSDDDLPEFFER